MKKISLLTIATVALALTSCSDSAKKCDRCAAGDADIEARIEDALSKMTLHEKIGVIHAQSKFSSAGVPRLGIPELWCTDGPHGIRPEVLWDEWDQAGWTNDSCVAFPALTCLAATWNQDLGLLYGKSIGEEARYRNKAVLLGPGVNICRTPLNGRSFEYLGEDPYLSGRMAVGYVKGVQSNGVAVCVKHYALNNNEVDRYTTNAIADERTLREIYLPAFKAAVVEGGAWSLMGGYNLFRGQHACHNDYLMNQILKGEWGFDGAVISDWGGTQSTEEAIFNSLDLEYGTWTDGLKMGLTNAYDNYYMARPYEKLIEEGKVGTKELDDKVRRVLRLIFRTTGNTNRPFGSLCSDEHYAAAQKIGEEGDIDESRPFLQQRHYAQIGTRYTKPSIISRPCQWGSGFHRVKRHNFHISKDLYLLHFGYFDMKRLENRFNDKDRLSQGWASHIRKRSRTIRYVTELKARNFERWTAFARVCQSIFRPPYALNKPAMFELKIVVRIPDRFRDIL